MKTGFDGQSEFPKGRTSRESTLCNFGFRIRPRCSRHQLKLDLTRIPGFRRLVKDDTLPAHYCRFVNENTALLDQCLACHLEKGYSLEDFRIRSKQYEI